MEVNLPNGGVLKITPRKIREVLGIPMGPIPFYAEKKRLTKDTVYCKFMAQLSNKKRQRTTTALSERIQKSEGVDFIFELSYLTLLANCFGYCQNSAMLQDDVLENVKSSKDIPNIDWCTLIWDYIKGSKEKWDDRTHENWYYGPHVTFTLIYLHYTEFDEMDVPRKYPAVKYWNCELIEERQKKEMARDAIGMMMVIEEDEENEGNENQKLKQEIYERIQDNFDRVLREKNELESIIKTSMEMYEGDATIGRFVVRFNTEFQIGIKTDKFGRLVDNKASTSRKDGDESETDDNAEESGSDDSEQVNEGGDDGGEDSEQVNEGENWIEDKQNVDENVENLEDAEKGAAAKAQAEKEAEEKAVKEAAVKEAAAKAQAEKEAEEKAVKEAAVKEAAAKAQAEKEAAEKAVKEAAEKEAAAKAQAEKDAEKEAAVKEIAKKDVAEKTIKEAASKEAATKAKEDKEAAAKEAAAKAQAEKEAAEKLKAEQEKANKEAEKKRKAAAKELNEKRAKEKAEKEAAKQAEIPEYESPSSPYNNKMSSVTEPLTEDETLLAHSLLSMEGDILDEMFNDGKGTIIPIITMQSISPGIQIDSQIIDAFVSLPEIEKKENKNLNAQIAVFKSIIEKDETSFRLRDVRLLFFPIIAHGHYYVTVFDLEKGNAVILDNNISDATYDGKYKDIFDFVKEMLIHYLYVTEHPSLTKFKEAQPKIPKMKWKTRKNKLDCGLYMMMHMEMFEGEIGLKWKTNIVDENNRHYADMIKTMRMRYAAKILLHDVNKEREKMSEFAIKFGEQYNDKEKQKKMVEKAIEKKAAEDK
ncbi:ulp1 protease family, C-terminal catalytic domain-containing protein [Artemisia annua]|uniref:Ulp1 protease family, C-terminal catalytic domain-containing protein n=1 Tax=Artemisia annua TaxID=35608 RepID=A0A2U1N7H1_ARTAN|nr:ulp1 protease family, C-terminal catalytic domain-containing protein [Artemisia annua]